MVPEIAQLTIGDPAEAWADLGFAVDGQEATVSGVRFNLDPAVGKGIRRWAVRGADALAGQFEGIPTEAARDAVAPANAIHANGVIALDHLVLATPDVDRTITALEAGGLALRRVRETDTYGTPMRQAFFRFGPVILEVIGGQERQGDGPARFFGLAWTVADLDATAAWFGPRLHPAKDAVQDGRRIATLDRAAGSTVAMAFMSPEPEPDRAQAS